MKLRLSFARWICLNKDQITISKPIEILGGVNLDKWGTGGVMTKKYDCIAQPVTIEFLVGSQPICGFIDGLSQFGKGLSTLQNQSSLPFTIITWKKD